MAKYNLIPVDVPKVSTKYRKIKTKLPVPESLKIFRILSDSEPVSMMGQPPVVWDKAEGFQVYDKMGQQMVGLVIRCINYQCRSRPQENNKGASGVIRSETTFDIRVCS
jgi:hypothetical protein